MLNSLQQLAVNGKPISMLGSFPNHRLQPLFGRGIMYGKFGQDSQRLKDLDEEKEPQLRRYFQK